MCFELYVALVTAWNNFWMRAAKAELAKAFVVRPMDLGSNLNAEKHFLILFATALSLFLLGVNSWASFVKIWVLKNDVGFH